MSEELKDQEHIHPFHLEWMTNDRHVPLKQPNKEFASILLQIDAAMYPKYHNDIYT